MNPCHTALSSRGLSHLASCSTLNLQVWLSKCLSIISLLSVYSTAAVISSSCHMSPWPAIPNASFSWPSFGCTSTYLTVHGSICSPRQCLLLDPVSSLPNKMLLSCFRSVRASSSLLPSSRLKSFLPPQGRLCCRRRSHLPSPRRRRRSFALALEDYLPFISQHFFLSRPTCSASVAAPLRGILLLLHLLKNRQSHCWSATHTIFLHPDALKLP